MQQKQSPMYVLMFLILGSSGININKTSTVGDDLTKLREGLGAVQRWQGVTEYRVGQLEKGE